MDASIASSWLSSTGTYRGSLDIFLKELCHNWKFLAVSSGQSETRCTLFERRLNRLLILVEDGGYKLSPVDPMYQRYIAQILDLFMLFDDISSSLPPQQKQIGSNGKNHHALEESSC